MGSSCGSCGVQIIPFNVNQPQPLANGVVQPSVAVPYKGAIAFLDFPLLTAPASANLSNLTELQAYSIPEDTLAGAAPAPAPAPYSQQATAVLPTAALPALTTDVTSDVGESSGPRPTSAAPAAQALEAAYAESGLAGPVVLAILRTVNGYRARHQVRPLDWSPDLAAYARNWTVGCAFAHSPGPYGENLALGYSTWPDAVAGWYDEVADYNFAAPGFAANTGHFTAVVWLSTTLIGCAATPCPALKGQFYACEFANPGNVEGQFAQNVLPP